MAVAITESDRAQADLLSALGQSEAFKVAEDLDRQSFVAGPGAAGTAAAPADDATHTHTLSDRMRNELASLDLGQRCPEVNSSRSLQSTALLFFNLSMSL